MRNFILTISILALSAGSLSSNTLYSILDGLGMPGDWSDGNYWSLSSGGVPCGFAPSSTDIIYIEQDMNLDVDITLSGELNILSSASLSTLVNSVEIKNGGTLNVFGELEVWDLVLFNGSTAYTETSSSIIVHNDFINRNNSDNVEINGTVTVTNEFYNGNGGVITGNGYITADTFTGKGTTFGISPNSSIKNEVGITLPIELADFNAKILNNKVNLNWTTTSEINNEFFIIERSIDGIYFEKIATIDGGGNSNTILNYNAQDYEPINGLSYYRLTQIDFDGKHETFDMIAVNYNVNVNIEIDIYPNPSSSYIKVKNNALEVSNIELIDITGKVINSINNNLETEFDVSNLQNGIYFIKIGSEIKKFIKK